MSWVKHDDNTAHHPKVLSVPPTARWVWFASTCYASRHLTDGFIPRSALKVVTPEATPALAAVLVRAGLWEAVDGGWRVHDYLHFQPTAESVKAKRKADRLRKESSGIPRGASAESNGNPKRSRARDPVPSRPDPDPQEQERESAAALVALWNAECGDLPKCRGLSKTRRAAVHRRLEERAIVGDDGWRVVIQRIAASTFCRGENDRAWRATFDWLLQPDVALKVLEGKYDDRPSRPQAVTSGGWRDQCTHDPPCNSQSAHELAAIVAETCTHQPTCRTHGEHAQRSQEVA